LNTTSQKKELVLQKFEILSDLIIELNTRPNTDIYLNSEHVKIRIPLTKDAPTET